MSALREWFIRNLRIENYSDLTIKNYVNKISMLSRYYNKCASVLTEEGIKNYI